MQAKVHQAIKKSSKKSGSHHTYGAISWTAVSIRFFYV